MKRITIPSKYEVLLRLLALVVLLWVFLCSINGLSASIKGFGSGVESLVQSVDNPIVGLMIGMLVTCLLQSSSTTTSLIVGLVASGELGIQAAVPMIMGANIGTTITNTLVSLGSLTRSEEFRRSFAAANIHDVFNVITVVLLLPLEVFFGVLSKPATWLTSLFIDVSVEKPHSPIKDHFKAVVKGTKEFLVDLFGPEWYNWALLSLSIILLIASLYLIVKTMKGVILTKAELFFDKVIGKSAGVGILFGAVITAMVQSSSVTTSILVPLAGTGVITLRTLFPITLGCNVGTTITALLAAMATGTPGALTIALCHVLFNVVGIFILYPIPKIRTATLATVEWLSYRCTETKAFAFMYVIVTFYVVPGTIIGLQKLFGG